jgi:hypothetical protein
MSIGDARSRLLKSFGAQQGLGQPGPWLEPFLRQTRCPARRTIAYTRSGGVTGDVVDASNTRS